MKPMTTPTTLEVLKTTAENIRNLRSDVGMPYRARMATYDAWLEVVEQAIAAEERGSVHSTLP